MDLCLGLDLNLGLVQDLDTAAAIGLGMGIKTWTRNPSVLELTCHLQSGRGLWGLGVGIRVKSQALYSELNYICSTVSVQFNYVHDLPRN